MHTPPHPHPTLAPALYKDFRFNSCTPPSPLPCPDFRFHSCICQGKDAQGELLLGGKYMCLWAVTHDLEHGLKHYRLADYNTNHPCSLCTCDTTTAPWYTKLLHKSWQAQIGIPT